MTHRPPTFLGPYRIESPLGVGGMGEVYLAFDERLERRVAIKQVLREKASARTRARFRREARAAASLSHPCVVQIYDILEQHDGDWIVMEYVEGPTVAALLKKGPMDLLQAVTICRDVAEGLAEAHEEGIVHRDLKTQNVALTPRGRAKILDFGLAKLVGPNAEETRISDPGAIVGTFRSMSPEQALGREVGPLSDLFSLGTMLYEMTTGVSPFLAKNELTTLQNIIEGTVASLASRSPEIPERLSRLVDRLLEKPPEHRPRSARRVAAELAAIAESIERPRSWDGSSATGSTALASTVAMIPSGSETSEPAGERRQVTLVSCGLVAEGSSDPEQQLLLKPVFERLAGRALRSFGARLEPAADSSGNLTVLFGYPQAHADDTQRAVRAAMQIVEELTAGREELESSGVDRVSVRAGVHTGEVVVGPAGGGRGLQLAFGETLKLAATIRTLAQADTVAVSQATYRLVKRSFMGQRQSARPAGSTQPLEFFQIDEYDDTTEFSDLALGRLVAQAARAQELDHVLERWKLARDGMGQMMLLCGEAGIGKTRLIRAFKGRLLQDSRNLIECRCSAFHRNTAFFPLLDFMERVVAGEDWLHDSDAHPEELETLSEYLPLARFLPRLMYLLEGPRLPRNVPLDRIPEAQKLKLLESIVALLLEMAECLPLVIVVEDLHWCDPSTLELLTTLVDQVPTARILIVLSFRPGFEPPWRYPYASYLTPVNLTRLHDDQIEALVEELADGKRVSPHLRREIARRSDGIPLFAEELTRLVLDASPADADALETAKMRLVPSTLQGLLTARLDQLGSAKRLAQLAAALGKEFSYELLREVARLGETPLQRGLDRLVEAELLHRRGLRPRVVYTFRHALLRDAAHESMLRGTRKKHHRRIARVLTERFPETVDKEPELLAHHFTEADMPAEAVAAWRRAAETALRASNHLEAGDHARRGLQLLELLPRDARLEHEIVLQVMLGLATGAVRGYEAPEAERAYTRARELWPQVEKHPRLLPTLNSLVLSFLSRAQLATAREMAEELLGRAEADDDANMLTAAQAALGRISLLEGDFAAARNAAEKTITTPATLGDLSWSLWFLGYPDQARETSRHSIEMLDQAPDDFTRAFACFRAGYLHVFLREGERVLELADDLMAFSNERGFLYFVAMAFFLKGHALATLGRPEEGIDLMSQGLDGIWATGHAAGRPRDLALLAETCAAAGMAEQGLSLIDEAAATGEASGQHDYTAEIHRLRGELLSSVGDPEGEAEACFRRAVEVARRQGARALEARAAASLARMSSQEGVLYEEALMS